MHRHLSISERQELLSTFVPGTQIFQERSPLLAGKQTSLMHREQSRTLEKNERTADCRSTLVSREGRVPTLRVESGQEGEEEQEEGAEERIVGSWRGPDGP